MALTESTVQISRVAGADLKDNQNTFVRLDATGQVLAANAVGQNCLGVLTNKPGQATNAAGEEASVAISGAPKIKAGAALAVGVEIKAGADGRAVSAATPVAGHYVMGITLEASAAADEVIQYQAYKYRQA